MNCFSRKKNSTKKTQSKSNEFDDFLTEIKEEQLLEYCVVLKRPSETFDNYCSTLAQILPCSLEDASKFSNSLVENVFVSVFSSKKDACVTLSLNLQKNNIPAGIMSLRAFNNQNHCYHYIESLNTELASSKDRRSEVAAELCRNNNFSLLINFCANDCSRLGNLIGRMLLLCVEPQSSLFFSICSEFKEMAKSTMLRYYANQILQKSLQFDSFFAEKVLLDIFAALVEYKDSLLLNTAAYIMSRIQSLSILVLQRYINTLQILDQQDINLDYTKCNLEISKIYAKDSIAHDIIATESKKDYRLFFDYIYQLEFLLLHSCDMAKVWQRSRKSVLMTINQDDADLKLLNYYDPKNNKMSLYACDMNALQKLAIEHPKAFLETLLEDDTLWKDVEVLDRWLILLMQFALNQKDFIKSHESLLINELAKGEKKRCDLIEINHLSDFEESLAKVADEIHEEGKCYFRLKKNMYRMVSPFNGENTTPEDRDIVYDFVNRNSINFLPQETPELFKFDFFGKFLAKVLRQTSLRKSVFAILCTMDPEKTKEFSKYAGDDEWSKLFISKNSNLSTIESTDCDEVCWACFETLKNDNEAVYPCCMEKSQIFNNEHSGLFLHTCGHRIHKLCHEKNSKNFTCMVCSNYYSHILTPQSIGNALEEHSEVWETAIFDCLVYTIKSEEVRFQFFGIPKERAAALREFAKMVKMKKASCEFGFNVLGIISDPNFKIPNTNNKLLQMRNLVLEHIFRGKKIEVPRIQRLDHLKSPKFPFKFTDAVCEDCGECNTFTCLLCNRKCAVSPMCNNCISAEEHDASCKLDVYFLFEHLNGNGVWKFRSNFHRFQLYHEKPDAKIFQSQSFQNYILHNIFNRSH